MSQAKSKRWVVDGPRTWLQVRHVQRDPISNIQAFYITYVEEAQLEALLKASSSNVLGVVRHDRSADESNSLGACPVVDLDLPQFNGPPLAEVWTSKLPVLYRQAEGIHCAMNDEVLFGSLQLEESPGTLKALASSMPAPLNVTEPVPLKLGSRVPLEKYFSRM